MRRTRRHSCSFLKKTCCSIADLQLCLKFCCTAKCFSCTYTNIYILFHQLVNKYWIQFLAPEVGLCCLSFLCILLCIWSFQTPNPPLPTLLPYCNHMLWSFLVLDEPSYPQLLRKSPDTYQKREIKPRSMPGLDIEEGVAVSTQADWCVSLNSPRLKTSALASFMGAQKLALQRPGSWVTPSWDSTSQFLIEEMTGLAWLQQCKCLDSFRNQSGCS